jgi:hypothetical protein
MLFTFLEIALWTMAYLIHTIYTPKAVFNYFKSSPFFEKLKLQRRKGIIVSDAQGDYVFMFLLSSHHTLAGLLMIMGSAFNMPQLWNRGYLIEAGYEVGDLVAMYFRSYPYHNNKIKQELRYALVFHHLPGLLLPFYLFKSGLNENNNVQSIAAWMVMNAGLGAVAQAYIHTLDFTKDMVQAAMVNNCNAAFFLYARFYVFPQNSFELIEHIRATESISSDPVHFMLYAIGAFLFVFNLALLGEFVAKTYKYNKAAVLSVMRKSHA